MSKSKPVPVVEKEGPRLFCGSFPEGVGYADRYRERGGDYMRLGFLSYSTLELDLEKDCPADLAEQIKRDAARLQARAGEHHVVSGSGQTRLLGERIATPCGHRAMVLDDPFGTRVFRCSRSGCGYVHPKAAR